MIGLYAPTEEHILSEITFLNADIAAGVTKFNVDNPDNFAANEFIIIEDLGNELAELRKISSITGSEITITVATSFAHYKGIRITKTAYDQRRLYRSTDGGTVYALKETKNIEVDSKQGTYFEDTSGTNDYYYKATYYNSQTLTESDQADSDASTVTTYDLSIEDIKVEAGLDSNIYISDARVAESRNEALNEAYGEIATSYTIPFTSPAPKEFLRIVRLIAAGYLLTRQYGPMYGGGSILQGEGKLKEGRDRLAKVATHKTVLLDENYKSLLTTSSVNGWPDDTTADETEDNAGGERLFRIKHRF